MKHKLRQKLILAISLGKLLFFALDNKAIALYTPWANVSKQWDQDNTIPLIVSSQFNDLDQKVRLDQSLVIINEMDDSQSKVMLLNDIALNYADLGHMNQAQAILDQSLSIANQFEDLVLKINTLNQIAKYYGQINQKQQAIEILDNNVELLDQVADKSLQRQLLLEISLKYGEIGAEETAQTLLVQSQTITAEVSQPLSEFPFTETPSEFKLGLFGNVNSFRDTTAFFGIDVDFYKQWPKDDLFVDAGIYLSFDSGRSVNNLRPQSLVFAGYRHHLNSKWSFFTDFFNSTNQSFFSSKNDDEDLEIITSVFVGGELNLWRGDSPSDFLGLQLGIGARYEYDYVDFEQRRNQLDPSLVIILLGRGFSLGEAKVNQLFAFTPALSNFNNYVISSDSKLSIPLSEKWSFTNRLFVRYRNEQVFEETPKLNFFFSTGLEYEF